MLRKVVRYDAKRKTTVEEYVDHGPRTAQQRQRRMTGQTIGGRPLANRPVSTRRKAA